MTQKRYTEIPKRQKCVNKEEPYIGGAEDIVDDTLGKPQSEVNQDRIEDIAAEVQRAQGAESTLDGKIGAEKTRAESVEVGLNTRLQTVEELAEISIGGGDAQIATGADFTNPDATKRAKVPTVGAIVDGLNDGIYDVSKRNPTAGPNSDGKFTLDYILDNADTLIPVGWRHGGMTISFVDSSDNNYVQLRCKTQSFSINTDDWCIDNEEIVVESTNYLYTITDSIGHLLCWIKIDGSVDWAIGIPKPVKDYVDAVVSNIWNGNEGTSIDGLNKVIAFLNEFTTSDTLKNLLSNKVSKESGKSLISEDVANNLNFIENYEYIDVVTDNEGKVIEGTKTDGKKYIEVPTVFKEIYSNLLVLSESGLQRLKSELDEGIKKIVCWGDSLTAGAGYDDLAGYQTFCTSLQSKGGPDLSARTNLNYPTMLKLMLGDGYSVANCGVGGETSYTIAARQGANPACLNNDIVLPAIAGQTVDIVTGTNVGLLSSFDNTILVRPLLQGHGNSVNPVYVDGVKCTLSVVASNYQASAYKLTRVEDGDRDETIKAGTLIIMRGGYEHINTQFAVLFVGTNDGYSENMLSVLKNMISHLHSNKYIVVGLHGGTEVSAESFEKRLEKNFGDKFFNWRKYVSSNALYDFGFTPTTEDLSAMNVGSIPPTLLHDNIHLNAAGYGILGYMLYQRFITLGYNK